MSTMSSPRDRQGYLAPCMGKLGHSQHWGMGSGPKGIKNSRSVRDCSQGQFALSKESEQIVQGKASKRLASCSQEAGD